jgi:hypothetical protein
VFCAAANRYRCVQGLFEFCACGVGVVVQIEILEQADGLASVRLERDGIACANLAGLDHAAVRAGSLGGTKFFDEAQVVHSGRQHVAGDSRGGNLE